MRQKISKEKVHALSYVICRHRKANLIHEILASAKVQCLVTILEVPWANGQGQEQILLLSAVRYNFFF